MIYKIVDLKAVDKVGHIYVLVHFWDTLAQTTGPPLLVNDFYMQLKDQAVQLVLDEDGYAVTESGMSVNLERVQEDPADPFVRETVKVDVPQQMEKNIAAYIGRVGTERGDFSWPIITRPNLVDSDTENILDRDDVKVLKGKIVEAEAVGIGL